ncbi:MAG: hypothetical protein IKF19_02730 [Bacilli bacterium]|nr:hypothetical protein [Bacilli bacterium]
MEVVYMKDYEISPNDYKHIDLKRIEELINEDINEFAIDESHIFSQDDKKVVCSATDQDNPIILNKDIFEGKYNLLINPKWYIENYDLVEKIINMIIKNTKNKKIIINSQALITDNTIDEIIKNENIEILSLCEFEHNNPYILDKKTYEKLKQSKLKKVKTSGVSNELKENYDDLIGYNSDRVLIGLYKYKDLISSESFYFNNNIPKEELLFLKYINNNGKIEMDTNLNYQNVIDTLKAYGKTNTVKLRITDKNKFNDYVFNNDLKYENITVYTDYMELPLEEYKKNEKRLLEMIKPAKNLSPFEKYIFVYNIVKQFKPYKEVEEGMDKTDSRNIYKILYNDYIVCVGYASLFGDLLKKNNIENTYFHLSVDKSYNNIKDHSIEIEPEQKIVDLIGHARRYVHIVDEKYDIDGFYIADPTWDNNMQKDLYNHMAMTNKDTNYENRYMSFDPFGEIFDVSNMEEFYNKLNYSLDRTNCRDITIEKNNLLDRILERIKKLDSKYYNNLIEEYPSLKDLAGNYPEEKINEIFEKLGEYIISHTNNDIPTETILAGIINVYKKAYGFSNENIDAMIPKVIEDNRRYQAAHFPKRYKIDYQGNKEVYMNEKNKFDIEYEKIGHKKK